MRNKVQNFIAAIFLFTLSGQLWAACNANAQQSTPTDRFSSNGDGTTTDTKTGLTWSVCPEGLSGADCTTGTLITLSWQNALAHVASQNSQPGGYLGHSDWRLPDIKELGSLLEVACSNPAINLSVFPNTHAGDFWSSTPSLRFETGAYNVSLITGNVNIQPRVAAGALRLVRDAGN